MKHPELRPNEIFIGNFQKHEIENIGYESKRLGSTAYDIFGNKLNYETLFPVFVKEKESCKYGVVVDFTTGNVNREAMGLVYRRFRLALYVVRAGGKLYLRDCFGKDEELNGYHQSFVLHDYVDIVIDWLMTNKEKLCDGELTIAGGIVKL